MKQEKLTSIVFINSNFFIDNSKNKEPPPNMWTKDHIGLYSQYAAVGLLYGAISSTTVPFCSYVYNGEPK